MRLYDQLISRTSVDKGWSREGKYKAFSADGTAYLLRISNPDRLERKRREHERMTQLAALGVPPCVCL